MKNDSFEMAKGDLYLLLNRGYPKSYALRFVSDHYSLRDEQRHILSRIVFSKSYIEDVKRKKINLKDVKGENLFIDGYNVIITTESVLMGKVFVSMDGLLRDTRNVSRKHRITKETLKSIDLILDILKRYPPKQTQFYLDKMMSKSGELSEILRKGLEERNLRGDSETVSSVDHTLKNKDGVIATNDSAIISQVERFIDLPSKIKTSRES